MNGLNRIEISKLFWHPDKKNQPVLNNINEVLGEGEFYGIMGPNGAGKTSVVRQLLRLQRNDGGSVLFDGEDINDMSRGEMALKMSFLPQNIVSNVDFTVFDVVAMGREPHRKSFTPLGAEDLRCIEEAMEFANCAGLRDKSISHISGGERQRVMIARTIAQDTPWIILDEPVSNLDVRHQAELMCVFDRLRSEKGKTIVAILHDLNLAAAFCTRIILMKDGMVYREGRTSEVLTKENLAGVYGMEFDFICGSGKNSYIVPKLADGCRDSYKSVEAEAEAVSAAAKKRWDSIAKPIDSLGLLEDNIVRICRVAGNADPCDISRRALVIMCGDHGVVAEGVTQTGSEVTRIVSENFAKGCSTVNYMAESANVDIYTIDIGMNTPEYPEKRLVLGDIIDRKISRGTGNIAKEPAMSAEQCRRAIEVGIHTVGELKDRGYTIIATGEMGIGNTTPTSALAAVLLGMPADAVAGKGAGLSADGMDRKRKVISDAVSRVHGKGLKAENDIIDIMAEIGGYEISGMTGIFLGGLKYKIPIVIDGAISAVSALCASKIDSGAADYMLASHESEEEAGRLALKALGLEAIVHGRMCLGEGTGAMTLFPLLDMAMKVYAGMGSFQKYNIEAYKRFEDK